MPTSTIEKLVTLTSSTQLLNELLDIINDIFTYTEPQGLKDLLTFVKAKMIIILWKFLEPTTKKEMKKTAFSFLLKIIDSYDNIFNADPEYLALFNFAIDHPYLRESSGNRPHYSFSIVQDSYNGAPQMTFNEYQQHLNSFHDLSKSIGDSSSFSKYDDVIKV